MRVFLLYHRPYHADGRHLKLFQVALKTKKPAFLLAFQLLDMGWLKGLEPSTTGITIQDSNQLSYSHH